ncbi:exonuclease mut-7 homolog isoform X2 [Antedon mediterranea]|uniref:exonuclease mut-7 homolog isoform X2 n=1 Tax=Antedon mediterranea TaxID=105859 RepID=UPI003AF9E8F5
MQQPNAGGSGDHSSPAVPSIATFQSWFNQFEKLWASRRDEEIRKMAERLFNQLKHNVLELVLFLMENNQDHFRKKTDTWTKMVLKKFLEMKESLRKIKKDQFTTCLTPEMQQRALYLATCGHYNVLSIVCRLFQLDCDNNQHLTEYINVMISRKQYKEACRCITQLNLQPYFSIHQVIVPLVLQDKLNLAEAYLKRHNKLQIELLHYLDQFCAQGFDVDTFIGDLDVPGIKKDKLAPRAVRKLVARLLSMYDLDSELCPNYDKTKHMGALKYLLHKRYNEPASCSSNWDDFVEQAIGSSPILQDELIIQFICYNDLPAAVKWAKRLNISRERMPEQVITAIDDANSSSLADTDEEIWEACYTQEEAVARSKIEYYQLNLPYEKIVIVDQEYMLESCIQQLTRAKSIIGIDMEWKPGFLKTKCRVAVVQLACESHIYLIDMLALDPNPDCLVWLMESILCDEDVLKLGYGIRNDLQMLVKSYPFLSDCVHKMEGMNDLSILQSKLESVKPNILGATSCEMDRGLSGLVNRCFGRPLDKKEQMSNWECRPLNYSQIVYAALDAYCLLEVFNYMMGKADSIGLNIDLKSAFIMNSPTKKVKTKRNKRRDKEKAVVSLADISLSNDSYKEPITPQELAVVCDTMLQGLGRQLRSCGVDVKVLENDQDHSQAVEIARADGRIILTRGTPYISLRSQVGDDLCYLVRCVKACDQLEEVLNFYNVRVMAKDIFSRCQMCNGNAYAKVSSSTMKEAYEKKNARQHGPAEMGLYSDPYGFGDDEFDEDDGFYFDSDVLPGHEPNDFYESYPQDLPVEDSIMYMPQAEQNEGAVAGSSNLNYKEGVVFSSSGIDMNNLTVGDDVEIQMNVIQGSILDSVDIFYICTTCGKIYWEGRHFSNVLEQYAHILHRGSDEEGSAHGMFQHDDDDSIEGGLVF